MGLGIENNLQTGMNGPWPKKLTYPEWLAFYKLVYKDDEAACKRACDAITQRVQWRMYQEILRHPETESQSNKK